MSPDRTVPRAPRSVPRQRVRVALLGLVFLCAFWLLAENFSAFMGLRRATLEGRLDTAENARLAYRDYWYGRPGPVWAGDDLTALAEGEVGFQATAVLTGLLIRELAGDEPPEYVLVPRYGLNPRPNLNISTIKNLTWGLAEGYTYDAVVDRELFELLRDTKRIRQYPLGVFVFKPRELPVTRFIIHTNQTGTVVYIVPAGESPLGLRLP